MKLFLVRHGQCLGQVDPTCTSPDSELTERGVQQANLTAQRLAGEGITHIVSSPLVRSMLTASIIADAVQCERITVWKDLREGWSGPIYRGLGRSDFLACFPKAELSEDFGESGWDHGGDSYESMFERSQRLFDTLIATFGDSAQVVMVTHGGIGNYLLHILLGIPQSAPRWFQMKNCAITQIRFIPIGEGEAWPLYPLVPLELLSHNDVAHLGALSPEL